MSKREIKIIKHDAPATPEGTPETVSPEETASDLEAERRSTVKDWIAEYRETDRIEKAESESDLNAWRKKNKFP